MLYINKRGRPVDVPPGGTATPPAQETPPVPTNAMLPAAVVLTMDTNVMPNEGNNNKNT